MNLSNEQIKKILDEAPEGATHWWTLFNSSFINGNGFYGTYEEDVLLGVDLWNQIPLSDLRKQLEVEWDGKGLPPIGEVCEIYTYDSPVNVDLMSWHKVRILSIHDAGFGAEDIVTYTCDWEPNFHVDAHPARKLRFRKLETEAEKVERERLESAYELYMEGQYSVGVIGYDSFDQFKLDKVQVKFWLAIVDKTNYRKGE